MIEHARGPPSGGRPSSARRRGRPKGSKSVGRPSPSIPDRDVPGWLNALSYAHSIDREPTLLVTVQWAFLASLLSVDALMRRLKNKAGQWLKDQTGEPAIWFQFREMGPRKGDHLHWLVWCPLDLHDAFKAQLVRWLTADATTAMLRAGALHVEPVTAGDTLTRLRSYSLKESPLARAAGLVTDRHRARVERRERAHPPVPGQRLQLSEAVNRAARKGAGYVHRNAADFSPPPASDNVIAFPLRLPAAVTSAALAA